MQGINSYEEQLRQPWKNIIDWEFINNHPEAKLAIWERYKTDIIFRSRIDEEKVRHYEFKMKFEEQFKSLNGRRGR